MGLKKIFKNRFNIIYMVIVLMLLVLGFRMAVLTIVHGEDYRQIADVKKIKDIPVKAPRGKIYDRNGVLLADNITSFTVQMYTDQIKKDDFNNVSFILSKILDENGERPLDDFPIELDTFDFIDEELEKVKINMDKINKSVYGEVIGTQSIEKEAIINSYKTAQEKVIELIKGNLYEWLIYESSIYGEKYNVKKSVINILKRSLKDMPIDLVNGQFIYINGPDEIIEDSDTNGIEEINNQKQNGNISQINKEDKADETNPIKIWLLKYDINVNNDPNQTVIDLLLKENKYIFNLFSNSKIRRLSYEFLKSKNLISNIKLVKYSFVQDNKFKELKLSLNSKYEEITKLSLAKDDFVLLTMKNSIDNLLQTVYETNSGIVMPGGILCEKLKEVYSDLPVDFKADGQIVTFFYNNEEMKNKYFNQFHLSENTLAYDLIKELAVKNYDILYDVITDDKVKYYSQTELLKYENPNISISDWEYTPIRNKRIWISNNLNSLDEKTSSYSAEQVFNILREKLKIDSSISDYNLRNMLVIRERYNKTSYVSYHPIDICYGISEKSVAMISERSHELNGINVEIEPIRYYPEYNSAAHVLGYLGKISQDYEINEYVVEKGYSPDDIIGKTGVEEKFEDYLRGEKGKKTVEVNNVGKTIKSVSSQAPVPGDDLYLTLDINLQKKAEESLEKGLELIQTGGVYESEWGDFTFKDAYKNATSGALVALDVKTGEVLALANYPSYDLNMFSTGISSEDWSSLLNDSKDPLAPKPLYNISLLTAIQPGSTFKMVTALAALEKGVDPNTKVYCAGTEKVGDRYFSCWIYNMFGGAHGYENMYEAIRDSCNFYFYTTVLGENLATNQKHTVKVDVEDIIEAADKVGLNGKTGIEIAIPQESSGGVPSIEGKKVNIRVYLRLFLEANIQRYLEDGYKIDESMKNEIVEEIVSWIDREEVMTRGSVYDGLKALRLNPDKTNDNGVPLVDIIKYSYINQAVWNSGDNLNISIGQGNNSYTTIQMANYISIISNGGYKRNVSVVKGLKKYNGEDTDYVPLRKSERIVLKDYSNLDVLKKGMRMVSEADSASPYSNFPVVVGSKTGTAQKEGINPETGESYDEFAWYVAFAPYDDPQIAVACVLFQGGSGRYPTPIVRDVIGEYLKFYDENE
ncbi:penicillin-binding protein 2 [Sedimentibacter acidaminivorans]|uniref:Penicillin-binding protein 2 n=1 Tax=Sedimentibacter acidaminivorans TaxID=913099 RepID=A0ABS4GB79_9FIRM|nr:penicillin-binding transpeptidase domain-containing protein [Sedimentibacter acidaminivorans]MBP1924940.1 penicillin-binding protein 2 [Sedimentibacter acidaminivorans]